MGEVGEGAEKESGWLKKSWIQQTLNFLTCADGSNNKKGVLCQVSGVTCHLSPVTCHQHQQPQPPTLPLLNPPLYTVRCRCWSSPISINNEWQRQRRVCSSALRFLLLIISDQKLLNLRPMSFHNFPIRIQFQLQLDFQPLKIRVIRRLQKKLHTHNTKTDIAT